MSNVGKLMLAAVAGVMVISLTMPTLGHTVHTKGIRPDRIEQMQQQMRQQDDSNDMSGPNPEEVDKQIPPDPNDKPSVSRGMQADRPTSGE